MKSEGSGVVSIDNPNYDKAIVLLEISEEQLESCPKISHVLQAANMLDSAWDYLGGSAEPDARALIAAKSRLTKKQAEAVPFEAFCLSAGVATKRALMLLTAEVYEQGSKASALLVAAAQPLVAQSLAAMASSDAGTKEKQMFLQHTGFLPVPKTSIINVRGDHAVIGEQKTVVLSPVEETTKRLGDRFAIAAASTVVDAQIVEE